MRQPRSHFKLFISSFSPLARSAFTSKCKVPKRGTFSEILGVSTSAEVDEGRRPFNPRELLKKLDQNFSTCNSSFLYEFRPIPFFFRFSMVY